MGRLPLNYSRLRLTKVERGGFFMLFLSLSVLIVLETRPFPETQGLIELDSDEVRDWLLIRDSLVQKQAKARNKIAPFNPNFISPSKADRLGLSAAEYKRFQDYRQQGKWINSNEDFERITGVAKPWMQQFSNLFKFPDFINKEPKTKIDKAKKISFSQANVAQLTRIRGIGPVMAQRIIRMCDQWRGIGSEQELMMIYGITPSLKEELMMAFSFDQKLISQRNINELHPSDLSEIPGVDFSLAKEIWEFVRLRQGLNDLEELHLLEAIPPRLFEVIQLYLYAMKNESKDG